MEIFCYETKEKFISIIKAEKCISISIPTRIINKPNRTAGGFQWCTDLNIFEGVDLIGGLGSNISNKKEIYCYETKEKFESITKASKYINLKNPISICSVINNNTKVAGGYHWCTDLSIFDGVELFYSNNKISSYEYEIVEFLKENNISNITLSNRKILSGKELDIYLPDYNIAIEFNGNYWHSEAFKYFTYHQDKVLLCLEKGIELISIFEFQYNNDKELYLNYILDRVNNIDRYDLELDETNNHNLQFCNRKYFTECYEIIEPQLLEYDKYFNIYDCGKIKFIGN